jgi:hypothetical protein
MIHQIRIIKTNDKIWCELPGSSIRSIKPEILQWLNTHASQCSTLTIQNCNSDKKYWACSWKYEDLEMPFIFYFTHKETAMLFKLTWI